MDKYLRAQIFYLSLWIFCLLYILLILLQGEVPSLFTYLFVMFFSGLSAGLFISRRNAEEQEERERCTNCHWYDL